MLFSGNLYIYLNIKYDIVYDGKKGFRMSRLLVVVDYQNDFVDGALGFQGAEKSGAEQNNRARLYSRTARRRPGGRS